MAKNEKASSTRTSIDEINDSLSSMEQHVEKNKMIITWSIVGIIVVAAIVLGYVYGIYIPNRDAANKEISEADVQLAMGNDSIALAKYMSIADSYSNSSANRAGMEAAILLYKSEKYEKALEYLNGYDVKEALIGAASQSLKGDCYVNLKNYDEALKAYDKAISVADGNPLYAPVFMMKKATVLEEQKNFKAAQEIYETISSKYPEYSQGFRVDMDKYIERAKAEAGE